MTDSENTKLANRGYASHPDLTDYPEFENPIARPRYTGLPTFLRAPWTDDLNDVDIGLIGVPYDGGVTNRPGSRHGPREVRNQSSLVRLINQATSVAPHSLCKVRDIGDAWVPSPFELQQSHQCIESWFAHLQAAGVMPLAIGGDHSVSLPILRAIAKDRPVAMVHIEQQVVQIGIRGSVNDTGVWAFSHDSGMRVIYIEELHSMGIEAVLKETREIIGDTPCYVSFDIDSLDPAYAPGTGTPEIGGLNTLEAQLLIRGLSGMNLVGADLVEVAPPFDHAGLTALAGANLMFELLCVLAEARARQS